MKSSTTPRFRKAYQSLPEPIRAVARQQYRQWQNDPRHSSLQFKKVGPFWSVRVTEDFRALALLRDGVYYWFWLGSHAAYEEQLKRR